MGTWIRDLQLNIHLNGVAVLLVYIFLPAFILLEVVLHHPQPRQTEPCHAVEAP